MPPRLPGQGMSLSAVIGWGRFHFKDDFVKIPTPSQFNRKTVHPSGYDKSLEAIIVGTAFEEVRPYFRATVDVLAWLEHGHVEVGYISQVGSDLNMVLYQNLVDSRIAFAEPFSWILQAGNETAVRHFDAFIQYAVLSRKGRLRAVSACAIPAFREHFPAACRDIALVANQRLAEWNSITAPLDQNETVSLKVETNPVEAPSTATVSPPLPAQNNIAELPTHPIETGARGEITEAVYQSQILAEYAASVITLTRKLNTITRLHACETQQLHSKIRSLEKSLASASKDVTKAKRALKKAQDKTRAAQDKTKQATKARAQRSKANRICARQQNDLAAWTDRHEALAASLEGRRQVAVA
ncbi:uncharacterized protein M421DRAFT_167778 [Didymella exigua CBS 183.55]|uniref:Uncharacterized protein n=1 Tax=Didymella exigua CBS 183.55 TaxID=1150837 RepID=A0A6A5RMA0_9PLEO|nr:uncharacterized protein M421DRAFT_167778 [Didymella exigua CBS 183.55]KAF1928114.1 hypothetical protein M421DRAFT_167778 [Didymella exigua CBS 183.55]